MERIGKTVDRICGGQDLTFAEARDLFGCVVEGAVDAIELSALLVALKMKGETPGEIAGAAAALRQAALPFDTGDIVVADTCGTGGAGLGTVNISTAVALLAAEMGIPVVKHGNRSVSSKCGSADVLEGCGVRIDAPVGLSQRCLGELNICFLFALQYHSGMRHAMPVRKKLGIRTVFNVIGPLASPAAPAVQLVGVYQPELCGLMAETLRLLGCERALVVHGSGLDEIALHGPTEAALLADGGIRHLTLTPQQVGLSSHQPEELQGGDATANAQWLEMVLAGRGTVAHQAAITINAGALCWVAGRAADHREGVAQASEALRKGGAADRLRRWAELSQHD